ncbi:MAG: tRNA (N(6)-L-threonylcarbamoyladenosine(37)-C(2))-methylthiotransferase MtaB [Dehalococcoidia bacterium]|nr:tRNA (N(6)-L-threonylcarbamoyladenosine(37)-C(2))-methylthiotransferase MtaB [Dehalococcoidia bacterium]
MSDGWHNRVSFYTLGCKLNQAETEALAGQFNEAGFELVFPGDVADIYVANTCTVTHIADRKSRHWLRLARRRNAEALLVATGCYAQRAPQELAPIADLVIGNKEKEGLLDVVKGLSLRSRFSRDSGGVEFATGGVGRVRSFVRIQDGCSRPCAYCIVPLVRPCESSLPVNQIMEVIRKRLAVGHKEVVLTGTRVGSYTYGGADLKQLLLCVLQRTNVERLRLSSLQPEEISTELVGLWQDRRLCRHFHLALQSGSDTVLRRMRRRYSVEGYQEAMDLLRNAIPGVAITTDVMIGFPRETDVEFEQSCRFCEQAGFANIHVFPFSPRPGTEAARMPDQVRDGVKKERSRRMLELSRRCRTDFRVQFLGQTMPVLWEKETSCGSGTYTGLTDNYIRVFAGSRVSVTNEVTACRLGGANEEGVWGEVVNEN